MCRPRNKFSSKAISKEKKNPPPLVFVIPLILLTAEFMKTLLLMEATLKAENEVCSDSYMIQCCMVRATE